MKLGIWFSTHPTAVVPTYLSSDLLTINATSKFDDVNKWWLVTQDIDFCVITIRNHKNLPGVDEEIRKFVDELKRKDIDVYLAFSCLLRPVGGIYRYLIDSDGYQSENWICPADVGILRDNCTNIERICSYYHPTGILLSHATFPSEHFCYGYKACDDDSETICDNCLDKEYSELDMDKRSDILTSFIQKISEEFNKEYKIAIKIDVDGEGNIEYEYGVKLENLKGIVNEVFFHILGNDEKTLKRVYRLSTEARKLNQDKKGIEPKLYVSILDSKHFERIYDEIKKHNNDIVIYSPNKDTIKQSVSYFLENKWEPKIKNFFYLIASVGIIILFYNTLLLLLRNPIELSMPQELAIVLTILSFLLNTLHRKRKLFPIIQNVRSIFYSITCLVEKKDCAYRKE